MASVKVCLWNIQNYGEVSGKYDGLGFDNDLRNRFLSRFLTRNNIDVVMVQEVRPTAQAALADLVTKLNALAPAGQQDWVYSFCACAIRNDDVNQVTSDADLIDRTGARSECYGVLWRENQDDRFVMIEGLHQIARASSADTQSPLNISQLGRPTGVIERGTPQLFGAIGGFELDKVFPYQYCQADGMYHLLKKWPKLGYPRTSILDARRPDWSKSRRPAYVVIKLNDGEETLCPIGAYHAPSNEQMASWGAYLTGLARELYVVDGVNADDEPTPNQDPVLVNAGFIGGDFNYAADVWPADYHYFVDRMSFSDTGGAHLTEVPPHTAPAEDRRTTVQIVTGIYHNQPITGPDVNSYLRLRIDLAFYPPIPHINATRVNLLTEVMANPGGAYNDPLVQTEAWMAHVEAQIVNPFNPTPQQLVATGPQYLKTQRRHNRRPVTTWVPIICGAWGGTFLDWATTRAQFAAHNITTARCAAEYIHIFVSDHLPLVATIDL